MRIEPFGHSEVAPDGRLQGGRVETTPGVRWSRNNGATAEREFLIVNFGRDADGRVCGACVWFDSAEELASFLGQRDLKAYT